MPYMGDPTRFHDALFFQSMPAPGVSAANRARMYWDATNNLLKLSQNGGSYLEMLTQQSAVLTANVLGTPTITVGAQAAGAIVVTVQLNDLNAAAVANKYLVNWWLSDTAAGAITGTGPSGTVAISGGSGVIIDTWTSKKRYSCITGATGEFKISLAEAGTPTWYLNVQLQDGRVFSSAAITFT